MKSLLVFPILTGLAIGTSYIPFPPWAILFGLAPLIVAWIRLIDLSEPQTRRVLLWRSFFIGWLAQFILNLIGFHWIAITAVEFGHFPKWAGVLTLLAFASLAHVYYGLAGAAAVFVFKKLEALGRIQDPTYRPSRSFFIALAFSFFALFEALWPSIFPWHLGYTWLWANFPGAQFADVIGFEGLNLVSLACNGFFALGWLEWDSRGKNFWMKARPSLVPLSLGIALFLSVNALGIGRAEVWKTPPDSLKILIAQGNIGNYAKLIVEKQKDFSIPIIEAYQRLTVEGSKRNPEATHVLWPETAFPDYLDEVFQNQTNWIHLRHFAIAQGKTILTGAYSHDHSKKETYNGFFAMNPQGQLMTPPYRKSILIPFGEKFPFSDIIPYTKWLFPGLGSFGQGPGPSVMELGSFKLGPQICLESLYPRFSAAMAVKGAEIFSNVTNDSWFGRTFEPYQHMTMTLARAVENRRPLLRSTNTGITTVVLATGQVLERSPIGEEWVGFYEVPFQKNPPVAFYSRIAGYTPWLSIAILLGLLIPGLLKSRQRLRSL